MLKNCVYDYHLNPSCVDRLFNLYEALCTVDSCSKCCINKTQELFCEALSNCDNDSYVNGTMCQDVRQDYCTSEWRKLELNESEELIDCIDYGETATLDCSNQFGLDENGSICSPLCDKFSQHSKDFTNIYIHVLTALTLISFIGGIIVLVTAIWKRKKM